ncbi:MAG: ATP-binding protein [Lachnospiraceae bacterium]|nr:ATP-binding protein [Lachnospiraceae bacterium]
MKNPFTHTPGRVGDANIETGKETEIFRNFEYEIPSESVYKIMGIRGSGKTVILGNILHHYKSPEMKDAGWLVYDLSSARDIAKTLISYLSLEPAVRRRTIAENANISVSAPFISAGVDLKNEYYDDEVKLEQMLDTVIRDGKKILICIDDVARTDDMTRFCSLFAKFLRNETGGDNPIPWPVYLVCSGVYRNFHELGETVNLTFFKRAAEIKTEPFSLPAMAAKYETALGIGEERAIEIARLTKGFAYAYQVIGSAFFAGKGEKDAAILKKAKSELFSQCYEKIWSELPEGEREILRIVSDGAKKRQEVLSEMKHKSSYQVNSNNLKNAGLLYDSSSSYGMAAITLPYFGEYIKKYC